MGPRHALTGAVLVVGGAALAGCALLLLRADLTTGTRLAALALWVLAALAVGTLAAFVREVDRHHRAALSQGNRRRRGERADLRRISKPLPGLVLLWVGGLTALAAFPFMLSGSVTARTSAPQPDTGATATTSASTTSTPLDPRSSATSVSRSSSRPRPTVTTGTPAPASTTPTPSSTSPGSSTTTSSSTSTTTSSPSTTTNPGGITITLLPKPTRTKG